MGHKYIEKRATFILPADCERKLRSSRVLFRLTIIKIKLLMPSKVSYSNLNFNSKIAEGKHMRAPATCWRKRVALLQE